MGIFRAVNNPSAGEIWLAEYGNPMIGEVRKPRPFLVLAPFHLHDYAQTETTLVPFTSRERRYRYWHAVAPSVSNGLSTTSWAACNQIITTKKTYLLERLGLIDVEHWQAIRSSLYEYLGF